jgi:hypothetical protein
MRVPGFTADASLYRTSKRYRVAATIARVEGVIQPAIFPRPDCVDRCREYMCVGPDDPYCVDNCECVCYGPPGCHIY